MNREEIKQFIPHREPMLLVDEAIIDGDGTVHAKYTVRGDEFFLQGHFPGHPVVPGVILCEIMAQSCAILVGDKIKEYIPMYAGINNVHFTASVFPGNTIDVSAKIIAQKGKMYFVTASASVEGKVCCKGEIAFALVEKETLMAKEQRRI
ncbi:MAG: 3-hydroxyacyl-ACP dehydratase FabZ [Bacteroidales bacterium]|jgi:3-hydroxyacyl-[acyl-carrier-protein] dehydratase|nr:3-hydroxyacyl-ACP dehydratase FabZ [Bacteroidales bacterium]MCI2122525.1 3-hydroxyacyl-ACP dehydratase FabZ [Bacteroidales bacterium]MCI2145284.1 3-hydroxyacyl-ACP dehydratase FabZ [Bacteroidales bacterium]